MVRACGKTRDDLRQVLSPPSTQDPPAKTTDPQIIQGLNEVTRTSTTPAGTGDIYRDAAPDDGTPPGSAYRSVHVIWPREWLSSANVICLKVVGWWGECIVLSASPRDQIPPLTVLVAAQDEAVEVWLADQGADLSAPIALLATVPTGLFSGNQGLVTVSIDEQASLERIISGRSTDLDKATIAVCNIATTDLPSNPAANC